MDARTTLIAAVALVAGAAAGAGVGVVVAQGSDRPTPLPPQPPTPPFEIAPRGQALPAVPPAPKEPATLGSPYAGDPTAITERYRPAFHAMGYEIGFTRTGVVGDTVRYTWWAHKRFEQNAQLPRLGGSGFQANPYGQPESEAAVKALLERVKQAEARK